MTTAVTRVCNVCGFLQSITEYTPVQRNGKGYRLTTCRACLNAKERARYAQESLIKEKAPLPASTVVCGGSVEASGRPGSHGCGILLRKGGKADNDLDVAIAHNHPTICCGCAHPREPEREPLSSSTWGIVALNEGFAAVYGHRRAG